MINLEKTYYLTPEGLEKFKEKLEHLEENVMDDVRSELRVAQEEEPDPTENPGLRDAISRQQQAEEEIEELKNVLNNYELIEGGSGDKVELGSVVEVKVDGEKDKFQIVGSLEADPVNGKISYESPVGEALLGAKPGEEVEAGGSIVRGATYKVLSVN
ncbi:MAG: GreA/GreB family elongation factor [Patescibacteria group bacterium]|nr:GreA/GreB family elongation factor [Patescibacteria group bacterium]